jgi:intraflagellar transport protein 88
MGDKKDMKKAFNKLLQVQIPGTRQDEDIDDEAHSLLHDELQDYLKDQQRKHFDYILKGARLIADVVDETSWEQGYDYIIDQLKSFSLKRGGKMNIVGEVEMAKALTYMKQKKFSTAIEALKEFEKKDKKLQARAATNLTYLYLLEGDIKNAQKHANLAVETDKYNASALVNKGCVHYLVKEYDEAKDYFTQALTNESDCVQAIYNLALVNKDLKQYKDALAGFKKLHQVIPESLEVIYQIASTYTKMGENTNSVEWYNMLTHRVPTDPGAQFDLGSLYTKEGDESNSYNAYLESYRYYPINMDVVSWLGLYFVKHEIYEKALQYFERATQIQPNEVNWQLMVASCHRRIGAYQHAKKSYEQIHARYPENLEGLRYLAQICGELGLKKEKKQYSAKLKEIEKRVQRTKKKDDEEEEVKAPQEDDILLKQQQAEQRRIEEQKTLLQQQELAAKQNTFDSYANVNDKRVENEDDLNIDDTDYIDGLYS